MDLPTNLTNLLIPIGDEIPKQRPVLVKNEEERLVQQLVRLALATFSATLLLMTGSRLCLGAGFTDDKSIHRELTRSG